MKKITLVFLFLTGFLWGQTVRVDVSELTDVQTVDLLANFGGSFAFFPAVDDGNGIWSFDLSTSTDPQNEYLWRVTFNDASTFQETLAPKVGGQGIDNDVAVGQAFNTDYVNFCNRIVVIGDPDPPTFYFNSFRQPGISYTELVLTAPAPGAGQNYYMLYDVNGFSEFGGPGTVDNGDGTYTAIVRPDVGFEYKWILNDAAGTAGADTNEDLLSCTNDGVTINTDNATFANRIHAAGEDKMDEFGVCPDTGGGGDPVQSPYCDTEVFHFGGNADSVINLTIENTGGNTMTITATNPGGFGGFPNNIQIAGVPPSGATIGTVDLSVPEQASLTLTWAAPPAGDVVIEFFQWQKTGTGGAFWQLGQNSPNITLPYLSVCGDPAQDVSLADLQLDGETINGFSGSTTTYNINVPEGDPVPVVTLVTPNNSNATVGTITQASGVPGTATFDVTSEDTTVTETYTINFVVQGPLTELVGNGSFETGDFTDWQQFESAAGNQTVVDTNPSEGVFTANINNTTLGSNSLIKSANRGIGIVNPGDEVTIKFDMRGSVGPGGLVFAELFSELTGGGVSDAQILSGGPLFPNADPEVWTSYEFTTNVGPDVSGGITLQLGAVTSADVGSFANIFFDNVSMVNNDQTLSVDTVTLNDAEIRVYPNPTQNVWNVKTNNLDINSIQIIDIQGRQVLDLNTNTTKATIDASGLPTGLYFARINTAAGTESIKLIKQ
ncbi:T9SS type A sorting domain-containing protein [Hanstruepera marina]|uniref:T9SS type A sorting domain-containing protein n=1 Tax=Hanstruepera marina TaxID=2873265 RepID=UPI001CA62C9C|nr:T9SS type A sorting domain-containing protein [Hanstruepera marina]